MSEQKKEKQSALVTLIPQGGIACRLRTIASTIHYTQKYERQLEILWQLSDDFPCPHERLFTLSPRLTSENGGVRIRTARWKDYITCAPPEPKNLFLTWPFVVLNYDHTEKLRNDSKHLPEQIAELKSILSDQKESLLLSSSVSLGSVPHMYELIEPTVEVNNILRSRMSGWQGNVVGVHINRTVPEGNVNDCPTELIIRRMQKMIEEDSEVRFFIATRSREEKERLAAIFKDRVYVPFSTQPPKSTKGIVESFGELLALSHTSYILSTKGSTFSEVAADIGGVDLEILSVFAQGQYYK